MTALKLARNPSLLEPQETALTKRLWGKEPFFVMLLGSIAACRTRCWIVPYPPLLFHPFWPDQMAGMAVLECSSRKVWAFPGDFLAWTYLWKPVLRVASDCSTDVAIWTGLTAMAGSCSEGGPNSLCDHILKMISRLHRSIPMENMEASEDKLFVIPSILGENLSSIGNRHLQSPEFSWLAILYFTLAFH